MMRAIAFSTFSIHSAILECLPSNTSIAASPVRGRGAVVRTDSVDLADGGDSNRGPDVHVSGHGGASDIEPVLVIRGQLLAVVCLDKVNPLGNLHLPRLLEMGSQGDCEDEGSRVG